MTAYVLDVPFTLFHFGVDVARDRGTLEQHVTIGVIGPLSALIAGLLCWLAYRRSRGSRWELMLLFLVVFGAGTFFGNLVSTAFVGDFSRAALALHVQMPVRYAASVTGLLLLCGLQFMAGWELLRLSPAGSSKLQALIVMVVIPVVAGAIIVALAFWSMPSALVSGRFGEASFWIFTAVGVLVSRAIPSGSDRTLRVGWGDVAVLVVAIMVVRVMAVGIAFRR